MRGSRNRRARPQAEPEHPERIGTREARALGKALADRRAARGLTVAELAVRAGMTADEIERAEAGDIELTVPLLHVLVAAIKGQPPPSGITLPLQSVYSATHDPDRA